MSPALRLDALRLAYHGDEEGGAEQALGVAPHVVDRHRIDQARAAVDIVDAKVVELDLDELACDLGRGVEAERVGALQVRFRLRELFLGRSGLDEAADLLLDELDGLAGALGA